MLFLEDEELPAKLRRQIKKTAAKPAEPEPEPDKSLVVLQQIAVALTQLAAVTGAQVQPGPDPEVGLSAKAITDRLGKLVGVVEGLVNRKQPPKTWRFEVNRNNNGLISGITAKQGG